MREQTQRITNKPFRQRVSKTEFSVNDTPTAIGNIVNATVKLVLVFRSHHCLSVEFPVSIRCYDHTPLFTVIQHTFGFIFFLYTLFSLFFFLLFFRNFFSFHHLQWAVVVVLYFLPPTRQGGHPKRHRVDRGIIDNNIHTLQVVFAPRCSQPGVLLLSFLFSSAI